MVVLLGVVELVVVGVVERGVGVDSYGVIDEPDEFLVVEQSVAVVVHLAVLIEVAEEFAFPPVVHPVTVGVDFVVGGGVGFGDVVFSVVGVAIAVEVKRGIEDHIEEGGLVRAIEVLPREFCLSVGGNPTLCNFPAPKDEIVVAKDFGIGAEVTRELHLYDHPLLGGWWGEACLHLGFAVKGVGTHDPFGEVVETVGI